MKCWNSRCVFVYFGSRREKEKKVKDEKNKRLECLYRGTIAYHKGRKLDDTTEFNEGDDEN